MSLVHCRGCGHAIHATAVACPMCGAPQHPPGALPVVAAQGTTPAGSSRHILIGLAAGFGGLVLLGLLGAMGNANRPTSLQQSELAEVATAHDESAAVREPRIMSDEEAEDANARNVIQQIASSENLTCPEVARFAQGRWDLYLQMGRDKRVLGAFVEVVSEAEKRNCI